MMMNKLAVPFALAAAFTVGCGPPPAPPPVETLDVRVDVPEPQDGMVDFVGPEQIIEPGKDVMLCTWLEPIEEELVISHLEPMQGRYGHHVIVLSSTEQREPGAQADCSSNESMASFKVDVLPSLTIQPFQGIKIPAGTQLVLQSHYVNATTTPLLTRDVIRITLRPEEQVTEWVSTFTTVDLDFELPPGQVTTSTIDCVLPYDAGLQIVGGHMHEEGSRFELLVGPDADNLESVYSASPWRSEFRDAPPIENYDEAPLPLPAGTLVRTICEWNNKKSETLGFPNEMCSAFGYLAGRETPFLCGNGQVVDTIGELLNPEE